MYVCIYICCKITLSREPNFTFGNIKLFNQWLRSHGTGHIFDMLKFCVVRCFHSHRTTSTSRSFKMRGTVPFDEQEIYMAENLR